MAPRPRTAATQSAASAGQSSETAHVSALKVDPLAQEGSSRSAFDAVAERSDDEDESAETGPRPESPGAILRLALSLASGFGGRITNQGIRDALNLDAPADLDAAEDERSSATASKGYGAAGGATPTGPVSSLNRRA